jgi:hypothetical protein
MNIVIVDEKVSYDFEEDQETVDLSPRKLGYETDGRSRNLYALSQSWNDMVDKPTSGRSPVSTNTDAPNTPPRSLQYFTPPSSRHKEYHEHRHRKDHFSSACKFGHACLTEALNKPLANGLSINVIGSNSTVGRWAPGSKLLYYISRKGLPNIKEAFESIHTGMVTAATQWELTGININFQETLCREDATFIVVYDADLGSDTTYAFAFFPGDQNCIIHIGPRMFRHEYINYIPNVLCHELSHVLGLRHEFWAESHEPGRACYFPNVVIDRASIMNDKNAHDLSLFVLSALDHKNIRDFYHIPAGSRTGFAITDCNPAPLLVTLYEQEHWMRRTFGRLSGWCSDGAEVALRIGIAYQQLSHGIPNLFAKQISFQFRMKKYPDDSAVFAAKIRRRG